MTIKIITGDCRDVLKTLPDNSVHMVCTSPPYYGLRDYGTAQWEGGDAACDHVVVRISDRSNRSRVQHDTYYPPSGWTNRDATPPRQCACGARRIDTQIGLEATPDEYIATMVAVFREVRRVLRPDGVCFVNLGDSYASGGKRPSQSLSSSHALACDSGGTGPEDYSAPDYACRDLCDGCQGALSRRNGRTYPLPSPAPQLDAMTDHDSERPASVEAIADDAPLAALASTSRVSSTQPRALCSHCANCGACLSVLRSSSRDARECVRSSWLNIPKISHPVKPKDLMMMPARVALALQADGWWIRSDIIWAKSNPMPESVTDRPTNAHEHVFLLTKSARYFFDADAVREPDAGLPSGNGFTGRQGGSSTYHATTGGGGSTAKFVPGSGRNMRNVWEIATASFSDAHFATFPPALVEKCIKAGTSERGCCAACGKPWVRVVEKSFRVTRTGNGKAGSGNALDPSSRWAGWDNGVNDVVTTGWQPSCACADARPPVPATVLDPFSGAGTTLLVADRIQRDAIGIELNPAYVAMARIRVLDDAPLLTSISLPMPFVVSEDDLDAAPPAAGYDDVLEQSKQGQRG